MRTAATITAAFGAAIPCCSSCRSYVCRGSGRVVEALVINDYGGADRRGVVLPARCGRQRVEGERVLKIDATANPLGDVRQLHA